MAFWIRAATLTIGRNKYDLDGLDFAFEIPFEDSDDTGAGVGYDVGIKA